MAVWKEPEGRKSATPVPVLFLDRDGVLVREMDYLKDPDLVELLPGVAGALVRARAAGYLLVGLSNQSGIGRGYFSEEDFTRVMKKMDAMLAADGAPLDGFYYCPHGPQEGCTCRKPAAGLLREVERSTRWDASQSWVIGDKLSDVELALGNEMSAILVLTGHGPLEVENVRRLYGHDRRLQVADDLPAAVAAILGPNPAGGQP